MKTIYKLSLFLAVTGVFSCTKKKEEIQPSNPPLSNVVSPISKILVLRVDYVSRVFEGGTELSLSPHSYFGDSLPVKRIYKAPADFGNLTLKFDPSNDTLFDGSIIWSGTGQMHIPLSINSASLFTNNLFQFPKPPASRFQKLHLISSVKDTLPWEAVSKLNVTSNYLSGNTRHIGYFLYTPSVGIGNPAEWDWFVFMSR